MKRTLSPEFINSINELMSRNGGNVLQRLINSLENDEATVAVRINAKKGDSLPAHCRKVKWAINGVYIDGERPRFTFDPALHQGRYYVQDASSMALEYIVKELSGNSPIIYIDSCAAPGGKTTAAINVLPENSLVIANEYERRRADALCENIIKCGYPNTIVTSGDTANFAKLGAIADIVAADVPCSGEGMMRKESVAIEQWTPALVAQCAALQRSIINNMWKALRPGGYFIYSTCTFNHSENEENIAYIAEALNGIPVDMKLNQLFPEIAQAIDSPYPAARFLPGRTEGEGLFVAVMQKPDDDITDTGRAKEGKRRNSHSRNKQNDKSTVALNTVKQWITANGYDIITDGDKIKALPADSLPLLNSIEKSLNVIYAGTEIALIKGHDAVPSQALALSSILNADAFPRVETDYLTALQFLSRQSVTLDSDTPKGFVLLTYGGKPLGFVKNLGNRANNLYPQGWAIKSTHFPETPPDIL